jgi:hypothetical protein
MGEAVRMNNRFRSFYLLVLIAIIAALWSHVALADDSLDNFLGMKVGGMRKILSTNSDLVFARNKQGYTLLHLLIATGHTNLDVLELLLANKADVNATNLNGATPLHSAIGGRQFSVVKFLLANKADINKKDVIGRTPLHMAAWRGDKATVELLLTNNADVNALTAPRYNTTPLMEAMNSPAAAEVILQHGGHGPKCATKPFVGWYADGDIRFHLPKTVNDDCQDYIIKNKLNEIGGFGVYYDGKTGNYAISWMAYPSGKSDTWKYALIYNKSGKRIKVLKYDHTYHQC